MIKITTLIVSIVLSISVSAQKDSTIADTVPLLSIRQGEYLLYTIKEKIKDKVTVKEFEDLTQVFNQVFVEAVASYRKKRQK